AAGTVSGRRRLLAAAVALAVVAASTAAIALVRLRSAPPVAPRPAASAATVSGAVYVHYYLWWTPQHWRDKLGAAYPYGAAPPPLPGEMDANGCRPRVRYPGAGIVDVPSEGLYDQADASTFVSHVDQARHAGIRG